MHKAPAYLIAERLRGADTYFMVDLSMATSHRTVTSEPNGKVRASGSTSLCCLARFELTLARRRKRGVDRTNRTDGPSRTMTIDPYTPGSWTSQYG